MDSGNGSMDRSAEFADEEDDSSDDPEYHEANKGVIDSLKDFARAMRAYKDN